MNAIRGGERVEDLCLFSPTWSFVINRKTHLTFVVQMFTLLNFPSVPKITNTTHVRKLWD